MTRAHLKFCASAWGLRNLLLRESPRIATRVQMEEPTDREQRLTTLRSWLKTPREQGLTETLREIRAARSLFLAECAARLEGPLNQYCRTAPTDSYEAKTTLCRFVNHELSSLNLGIICPNSGHVGILAGHRGDPGSDGRFRISVTTSATASGSRPTWVGAHLPELRLGIRTYAYQGRGNQREPGRS